MRNSRRAALAACLAASSTLALAAAAQAQPPQAAPAQPPATIQPGTLAAAIALAYETNPTLQAARAQLRATDEEYVQAEAGLRPSVTVSGGYSYGNESTGQYGPSIAGANFGSASASISLRQPIYTGGRVTGAMDAARGDIMAGREGLRRTEISVLQSVIGAYLDLRRDQEQVAIGEDNVNVLVRQLDETKARFDVGQLTRTDVAQSQARLAQARAQLATSQSQLAQGAAAYDAVVGENPGQLAPEPPIAPLLPADVDAAFDYAERNNPQIRQANDQEAAAAARLAAAKALTRPEAALTASYGYYGSNTAVQTNGGVPGVPATSSGERVATVGANITLPLVTGGMNGSEIRQAAETDNAARINVEVARRQVLQAVAQAWDQLLGARANLDADDVQVKADTVAFEGVREEQRVGLRTTLDVLNAQQELEQSQLALVGARHDEYLAAAAVLAAMGALEARALLPDERLYDPKTNLGRVSHAPGWVPWEKAVDAIDRLGAPQTAPPPAPSPPGEVVRTDNP
jgi:outer membrane protein